MLTDHRQEVQRFAEALMTLVRDRAIEACDRLASGRMVGPDGERWSSLLAAAEAREAVVTLIPDVVDQTLFNLLNAIDNDELALSWRQSNGSFVSLNELCLEESAGWLMGSPGWRHQYSSQRFFDPLADLRLGIEPDLTEE